jgi:cell division septation protein DedD
MTVADLKAGMKGQATVTTTSTVTPVVVTELRSGMVLSTGMNSVMVLDRTDGVRKKFTLDQLNARGVQIYKDGKVIPISQLNRGDEITATVISQRPPDVVTEREVEATLAQAPAKTEAPAAKSEPPAAPATKTEAPAVVPPPATPMATQSTAAAPAPAPAESSGLGTGWYLLIAVVIAAILFLVMRRRKDESPSP